jgi:hypothetical protein
MPGCGQDWQKRTVSLVRTHCFRFFGNGRIAALAEKNRAQPGVQTMQKPVNRNEGWTIIQTMAVLLVVGILLALATNYLIDRRCEADPSRALCAGR